MSTIAIASDMHLDMYHNVYVDPPTFADIIVMAGDIHSSPIGWEQVIGKIRNVCASPIILVMGNHEYYGKWFPDAIRDYKIVVRKFSDVHLLNNETVSIGGVTFIGATMWTNMREMREANKCEAGIADFRYIKNSVTGFPITPDEVLREFNKTVQWMRGVAHEKCVVVTHHAPSFLSSHPKYALSPINGAFCSNLDSLVEEIGPELWIHGHVHDPISYYIGKTKVVCNPWGYPLEMNERRWRIEKI